MTRRKNKLPKGSKMPHPERVEQVAATSAAPADRRPEVIAHVRADVTERKRIVERVAREGGWDKFAGATARQSIRLDALIESTELCPVAAPPAPPEKEAD
jgi:hypothetical protein